MVVEIGENYDLSKLSTLRVKAQSEYFAKPSNLDELKDTFSFIRDKGLDVMNFSINYQGCYSN